MAIYCIYGADNDSYAFRASPDLTELQQLHQTLVPDMSGEARADVRRCEACGTLLDKWNESLVELVVKKRKFDISHTYDGVIVVSARFKSVYKSAELSGLHFRQLPDDPDFFAIRPERAVEYDPERRGTRFENRCSQCGLYESVAGATPVFLKQGATVKSDEFVRTDLEFGSDDEKSPLLLCGSLAAKAMKAAGLKGLDLKMVQDSDSQG